MQWVGLAGGVAFSGCALAQALGAEDVPFELKMSDALRLAASHGTLRLSSELASPRANAPSSSALPTLQEKAAPQPVMRLSESLQPASPQGTATDAELRLATALPAVLSPAGPVRRDEEQGDLRQFPALLARREIGNAAQAAGPMVLDFSASERVSLNAAEEDEDQESLPQPPPRQGQPQAVKENELPDLSAEEWALAPIRWSGLLTWGMNRNINDNHDFTSAISQTNALQGSSYVFAPWFATATGNLNYSTLRSWSRSHGSHEGDTRTDGKGYGFGGGLSLFPQSHFPIQTYYDFSRNKTQSEEDRTKYISTRFGFSQTYQPPGSVDQYAYTYNRQSNKLAGPNTLTNSLTGNYTTRVGDEHTFNANLIYTDEEKGLLDVMGKRLTLTGNHAWRVEDGLNINSYANINQTEDDVFQGNNDRAKNRSLVSQFNSSFNWQPYDEDDEPLPMVITGQGTLMNIEVDAPDASKNRVSLINGSAGLNYRFTDQLMGTANANLTRVDSNSMQSTTYGLGGSMTYSGTPTQLGSFLHSWSTGLGANYNDSSNAGGTDTLNASFGQGLSLPLPNLTLNLTQNLSGMRTSSFGVVNTLSHSVGVSRQFQHDETSSGTISVNYSHHKTAGTLGGHSNSFSAMGSGQWQISRRQALGFSTNATWMKQVQQKAEDLSPTLVIINNNLVDLDEATWAGSASFTYNHVSPFDVSNLNYMANLMFSSAETSQQPTLANFGFDVPNPNFRPGNERHWIHTMTFNHALTYRIGRLNFQLMNILSRIDGVDNVILFGQITRSIGGL